MTDKKVQIKESNYEEKNGEKSNYSYCSFCSRSINNDYSGYSSRTSQQKMMKTGNNKISNKVKEKPQHRI